MRIGTTSRTNTAGFLGTALLCLTTALNVLSADEKSEEEPPSTAYPFTASAPCTGDELIRAKVVPSFTDGGSPIIVVQYTLSGATPGTSWGYGTMIKMTNADGSGSGQASDGRFVVPASGRGEVTRDLASAKKLIAAEIVMSRDAETPLGAGSTCTIDVKFRY